MLALETGMIYNMTKGYTNMNFENINENTFPTI